MIEKRRQANTQTGSPQSPEQWEQHFIPRLPILFILQSMPLLYSLYWCRRQLRRSLYLPPFVLQLERECTADALLSAARPASEQCIGLMQCSCVLTHSTSPPPPSLRCNYPLPSFARSLRSSRAPSLTGSVPCLLPLLYNHFTLLFSQVPCLKLPLAVGKTETLHSDV